MVTSKFIEHVRSAVERSAESAFGGDRFRLPANLLDSKVVGNQHVTLELAILDRYPPDEVESFKHHLAHNLGVAYHYICSVKVFQPMGSYPGSMIIKVTAPIRAESLAQT